MLDTNQKDFIRKRVKALGSLEKVKQTYKLDDLVTKLAHEEAEKLYGKEGKK